MKLKRLTPVLAALCLFCLALDAQVTNPPSPSGPSQPAGPAPSASPSVNPLAPKPYAETEFPDWLKAIRRFEVIAVGSFPVSFLYVNLAYDVGRWAVKKGNGEDNADTYAPFLFAPPNKPTYTQEETTGLILATLGVAVGVAIGDLVIGLIEKASADAKAAADKQARDAALAAQALQRAEPAPSPSPAASASPEPSPSPEDAALAQ